MAQLTSPDSRFAEDTRTLNGSDVRRALWERLLNSDTPAEISLIVQHPECYPELLEELADRGEQNLLLDFLRAASEGKLVLPSKTASMLVDFIGKNDIEALIDLNLTATRLAKPAITRIWAEIEDELDFFGDEGSWEYEAFDLLRNSQTPVDVMDEIASTYWSQLDDYSHWVYEVYSAGDYSTEEVEQTIRQTPSMTIKDVVFLSMDAELTDPELAKDIYRYLTDSDLALTEKREFESNFGARIWAW